MKWLLALLSPKAWLYLLIALGSLGLIGGGGYLIWKSARLQQAEQSHITRQDQNEALTKHIGQESQRLAAERSRHERAQQEAQQHKDYHDRMPESVRSAVNSLH